MKDKEAQLIQFIKRNNGLAKYSDLIEAGFYKAIINSAITARKIERINRGVYSLPEILDASEPDLITATFLIPQGVICLISALSYYEVTDEIPNKINIAIPSKSRAKKVQDIPINYYRFSQTSWEAGIEEHTKEGHKIRIYSLAKTIIDCFKFRNQIGMDVACSALKTTLQQKKASPKEIMKYAYICRVTKIIKPILEVLI